VTAIKNLRSLIEHKVGPVKTPSIKRNPEYLQSRVYIARTQSQYHPQILQKPRRSKTSQKANVYLLYYFFLLFNYFYRCSY
jgi:hypothetical protein